MARGKKTFDAESESDRMLTRDNNALVMSPVDGELAKLFQKLGCLCPPVAQNCR